MPSLAYAVRHYWNGPNESSGAAFWDSGTGAPHFAYDASLIIDDAPSQGLRNEEIRSNKAFRPRGSGFRTGPRRLTSHDVEHRKMRFISASGSDPITFAEASGYGSSLNIVSVYGASAQYTSRVTPPNPDPAEVQKAFASLKEQMPAVTLIPNFLWELRNPKELVASMLALRNRFIGGSLNDFRKFAGSRWLKWSFEIKPLIGDIQAILGSLESVASRIRFLKRTAGKPTTVRRIWFEDVTVPASPWTDPYPVGVGWSYRPLERQIRRKETQYRVKHVVGATMHHNISVPEDFLHLMSGMLAALGFNRPLSIIWEAIPWSWLIDYFIRIGDFLEGIKTSDPFEGKITLSDGWVSSKCENVRFVHSHRWTQAPMPIISGEMYTDVAAETSCDYYIRRTGIRMSNGISHLSRGKPLTLQQYLNIASAL